MMQHSTKGGNQKLVATMSVASEVSMLAGCANQLPPTSTCFDCICVFQLSLTELTGALCAIQFF